jgi:MSHA biogenesis protein MshJ
MKRLKEQWADWSARFVAMQQREKLLVSGAALVAILFGGYSFWIEPAQLQKARLKKSIEQQQTEQGQLSTQLAALLAQGSDPDAANRALLQQMNQQLAEADRDIHGFDRVLVTPSQAPALLQTLLARHRGLALVSLTTLSPQPLIAPPAKGKEEGKATAAKEEKPAMPGGNIYKHGIEVKVSGSYHDLLAYVSEIEGGPQKLIRGSIQLKAEYPVSELTLTVYTLSLEAAWLVV